MTPATWLACTDPQQMLDFVGGSLSERKLRLFSVACCRRIWHLLADSRSRHAVEVAEKFADGLVTAADAQAAGDAAAEVNGFNLPGVDPELGSHATTAALYLLPLPGFSYSQQLGVVWRDVSMALECEQLVRRGVRPEGLEHWYEVSLASGRILGCTDLNPDALIADILRELVNPFLEPATWLTPTVSRLAETVYRERAFDRLPILADACEEAGCTDSGLLAHCRQGGEHAVGCWAVDVAAGRE